MIGIYHYIRERMLIDVQGDEVVNAIDLYIDDTIDLYIDDRTLHEWYMR